MITAITAASLGLIWKELLSAITRNGSEVMDGDAKLTELCHVMVTHPDDFELHDPIFDQLYDQNMIEFMKSNFFETEPIKNWGYSYGQRFLDYHGINQLEEVVQKLKVNPDSKSATVCLADPTGDRMHVPCIYCVDFKLRNRLLDMTAYFRSQDAGKKYCADAYCLKEIQSEVAEKIGCKTGKLFLLCSSMHIYETDLDTVRQVINFPG